MSLSDSDGDADGGDGRHESGGRSWTRKKERRTRRRSRSKSVISSSAPGEGEFDADGGDGRHESGGRTRKKERRTRRRSRSKSVGVVREKLVASALGEDEVDCLTLELGGKVKDLDDDLKDKLRRIGRVDPIQWQVHNFKWDDLEPADQMDETEYRRRIRVIQKITADLMDYADPIPAIGGFIEGIEHFNMTLKRERKHDVVRAIHSKKMHYLRKVQRAMADKPCRTFKSDMPDMSPVSNGSKRLSQSAWDHIKDVWRLDGKVDYIKHICEAHAGEARLCGESWWQELDMTLRKDGYSVTGEEHKKACFWHYQYMSNLDAKHWLHARSQEDFRTARVYTPTPKETVSWCDFQ